MSQSQAAFRELLELVGSADQSFLAGPRACSEELDRVEGYRHLTHLLGYALELYLEGDPERPQFVPLASPMRKILGDNVDSLYFFAPLDGRRRYRIRGVRGNGVYLAFCIYGGKPDGQWSERVVANLSQRDIRFDSQGRFEICLAPEPREARAPNFAALDPDAVCVISREYFADRASARPSEFAIEVLPAGAPPPPLSDAALAARLRAVANFVRETLRIVPLPPLAPNALGPPMPWNPSAPGWGTPDNVYALGSFRLEPDEALLVEGSSPACTYFGMQLWNRYMQSLDYRYHRVSLNGFELAKQTDGSFRIAIAARDPGVPNWLDTAGHREGIFFCRWLQADELPAQPHVRLVRLAEIAT